MSKWRDFNKFKKRTLKTKWQIFSALRSDQTFWHPFSRFKVFSDYDTWTGVPGLNKLVVVICRFTFFCCCAMNCAMLLFVISFTLVKCKDAQFYITILTTDRNFVHGHRPCLDNVTDGNSPMVSHHLSYSETSKFVHPWCPRNKYEVCKQLEDKACS